MTLLTFKSWDIRAAFLKKYGGQGGTPIYSNRTTPISGRHVRISPFTPQWQRKLEAPIRILLAALAAHPDTTGKPVMILWKTLTIMEPQEDRDFRPDRRAWARLFYEERDRSFVGRLEVTQEFASILQSPPQQNTEEATLFTECWNTVLWGSQQELDKMERAAYHTAKQQGASQGYGTIFGRSRKHWSQTLLRQSEFSPYPFQLDYVSVEKVAFVWDEFCDKAGQEAEKIGDYSLATYQGKPAAPAETTPPEDEVMADSSKQSPITPPQSEAAPRDSDRSSADVFPSARA